jgi:Neuraminidase (sialidase)
LRVKKIFGSNKPYLIMKFITVYKDPNFFSSFPSLCILPNGEIIVAFRRAGSFSVQAAKRNEPTHHDTNSEICLVYSKDNGESYDMENQRVVTRLDYGVNDPGISLLSNGKLVLRSCVMQVRKIGDRKLLVSQIAAHRPDLGTVSCVVGFCVQFSEDQGATWSKPEIIETVEGISSLVSREQVVELEDGTLMLSVYTGLANRSDNAYVIRSWDRGRNWQDASLIAADENGKHSVFQGISFNETAILNLGNGKILALLRADSDYHTDDCYMAIGGIGQLFQSFSYNAGFSWTKPRPTGIFGQPAHLLRLRDGRILCTYGYRKQPFGVKAVISDDNGSTWNTEQTVTLKQGCQFWDMGYPVSDQRNDGKIVTVYYWNDEEKTRFIESVIWEITI